MEGILATQIDIQLPLTPALGERVRVRGKGASLNQRFRLKAID
jgi:hypothetical protein